MNDPKPLSRSLTSIVMDLIDEGQHQLRLSEGYQDSTEFNKLAEEAKLALAQRSETAFSQGDAHPCDISKAVREQTIKECAAVARRAWQEENSLAGSKVAGRIAVEIENMKGPK